MTDPKPTTQLEALHRIANLGTCAHGKTPAYKLFQEALDIAVSGVDLPVARWLPVTDDAKSGKLVWLLVDYRGDDGDHPLEDAEFAATLGYNSLADTGDEEWKFVGWCWTHDHFVDGKGKVLAWKPIGFDLVPPPCFRPIEGAQG